MKTKEKYEANLNQNNKLKPIKVTKVRSNDPMIRSRQMSQEQKVYSTTDTTIKKRDTLYFERLGARLADEECWRIFIISLNIFYVLIFLKKLS